MSRFLFLTMMLCLQGCASYRGIPSHGGGKRFDEEQRVVAGSIRYAVADMRLEELKGLRVMVQTVSIPTSGAGNLTPGGLQDVELNLAYNELIYEMMNRLIPLSTSRRQETNRWNSDEETFEPYQRSYQNLDQNNRNENRTEERKSAGLRVRYRLEESYFSQRENTEGDVNYLRSVMTMKAHHDGIGLAAKEPDAVLYVLVDVLGTNRRRKNYLIWKRDDLAASCEMTYYAKDTRTGQLIFPARRAAAKAVYVENRVWPLGIQHESREYGVLELSPFPLSGAAQDLNSATALPVNGHTDPVQQNELSPEERANQLVNTARAQLRVGRLEDARDVLKEVIQLDPMNTDLRQLQDEYNLNLPRP